jgi:phage terminase small subunit
MPTELNPKQLSFCNEFIIDHNGTQSAIRAGYSEKTANRIADQLLSKLDINAKIAELEADIQSKNKDLKQRLIDELTRIATVNVDDHIQIVNKVVEKIDKEGNTTTYETEAIELKPNYDGRVISKIKIGVCGLEVTFHDKTKAIELLGKHLSMFNEITENPTIPLKVTVDE